MCKKILKKYYFGIYLWLFFKTNFFYYLKMSSIMIIILFNATINFQIDHYLFGIGVVIIVKTNINPRVTQRTHNALIVYLMDNFDLFRYILASNTTPDERCLAATSPRTTKQCIEYMYIYFNLRKYRTHTHTIILQTHRL